MNIQRLMLAAILAFNMGLASAAVAPSPLNNPQGLALDSKGNLYVANPGLPLDPLSNEGKVLVYSPRHVQLTARTITKVGFNPWAVALNSKDQLYVADSHLSTLSLYNGKVQDPTKTKTTADGISHPSSISVDGMDSVWVADHFNGSTNLDVFGNSGNKLRTQNIPQYLNSISIAKSGPMFAAVDNTNLLGFGYSADILTGVSAFVLDISGVASKSITTDKNGVLYLAISNGQIIAINGMTTSYSNLFNVPYAASGIAVDSTRKLVYLANDAQNTVDVYTTAGVLVTTLH